MGSNFDVSHNYTLCELGIWRHYGIFGSDLTDCISRLNPPHCAKSFSFSLWISHGEVTGIFGFYRFSNDLPHSKLKGVMAQKKNEAKLSCWPHWLKRIATLTFLCGGCFN